MAELIIGDDYPIDHPDLNAGMKGYVPRDPTTHPNGFYKNSSPPDQIKTFGRDELLQRIKELETIKGRISDIRNRGNNGKPIPALDQGQVGYCWAHSTTSCVMLLRAVMNLPYVPLSAYGIAATIKKGQDEGGWGAQSMDFAVERGIPSQDVWAQGDRDYRGHDKPETWESAKLHKVTEGFFDMSVSQYDRKMTDDQVNALLVTGTPVVGDFNWWSHSVGVVDLVNGATEFGKHRDRVTGKLLTLQEHDRLFAMNHPVTGGLAKRILNSWGDKWSENGSGLLTGDKAILDGAVAPLVTVPSDK